MNYSHLSSTSTSRPDQGQVAFTKAMRRAISLKSSRFLFSILAPLILGGVMALPDIIVPQVAQAQSGNATARRSFNTQQTLRLNDTGVDVLRLQKALVELNFLSINIPNHASEGSFGPATERAVRQFQQSEGNLIVDGIAGPKTLSRLFSAIDEDAYFTALMQGQLRELGYYNGALDGQMGQKTRQALRSFQAEMFIDVNPDRNSLEEITRRVDQRYELEAERRPSLLTRREIADQVGRNLPNARIPAIGGDDFELFPPATTQDDPYVVLVPEGRDRNMLRRIRSVAPNAEWRSHPRGDYVHVGSFDNRGQAEELKKLLDDNGFAGARVFFMN